MIRGRPVPSNPRQDAHGGFTLIELLMTIAITALFSAALYGVFMATVEMSRGHESQARAQADGRTALDRIARDIRQSISADGGLTTPVDSVSPTQLILFVDTSRDASRLDPRPNKVRYRLVGDRLVRQQAAPIGTTAPFSYGAYGPAEVMVEGVLTPGAPIFAAVTEQGASLGATVNPPASRDVAQLSVRLRVANRNGNDSSKPTELSTDVALRNVITL